MTLLDSSRELGSPWGANMHIYFLFFHAHLDKGESEVFLEAGTSSFLVQECLSQALSLGDLWHREAVSHMLSAGLVPC